MQIIPSVIQAVSSPAQNQQPASHIAPLVAGNDLPTDKLADILAPLIQPITKKPLPADTSVFVPSPAVPEMLEEDEAVTSLPEERPENYVTEMVQVMRPARGTLKIMSRKWSRSLPAA